MATLIGANRYDYLLGMGRWDIDLRQYLHVPRRRNYSSEVATCKSVTASGVAICQTFLSLFRPPIVSGGWGSSQDVGHKLTLESARLYHII